MSTVRKLRIYAGASIAMAGVLMAACGGGGSSHQNSIATSASNVETITVNSGPAGTYANGVFTSVMVCVPSSSNCQTIDGILVDTGSYGLRLLSSTGDGALTLPLPYQTGSDGNPIGECAPFVSGLTWGPVATADITISGEKASNLPVQVIDGSFASLPKQCAVFGVPEQETLAGQNGLGANGILGIGPLAQDCGSQCAQTGSSNPGLYYDCAGSSCSVTGEALAQQVQNPVAAFATDNNGVIVELPSVPNPTASLTGSLVFGIGTQSNNALSNATVFPINSSVEFSTGFKGQTYPAFVDSGSNAYFFLDSATTSLPECSDNSNFYCPASNDGLSAATAATGAASQTVKFTIGNADSMFSGPTAFVFPTLGGPNPGTFDWGLPFFFGRNVYTAISGKSTSGGQGPYWAF
jgi:Protein of unknown function (DUF3443)